MSDYGEVLNPVISPDYVKDPDSVIDYEFDWAAELNGDTIASSDFLLPDGLVEGSTDFTDTTTTVFVSGGSAGALYRITNRVTTAGGRTFDKTIMILVQER